MIGRKYADNFRDDILEICEFGIEHMFVVVQMLAIWVQYAQSSMSSPLYLQQHWAYKFVHATSSIYVT